MKVYWYLLLDSVGSWWRRHQKMRRLAKRWPGRNPIDMERSGRRYTRVLKEEPDLVTGGAHYTIRPEPGWEWTCQQCHTYSLIRESDMPAIISAWEAFDQQARARGFRNNFGRPTAATAGCPECKMRPGAPE